MDHSLEYRECCFEQKHRYSQVLPKLQTDQQSDRPLQLLIALQRYVQRLAPGESLYTGALSIVGEALNACRVSVWEVVPGEPQNHRTLEIKQEWHRAGVNSIAYDLAIHSIKQPLQLPVFPAAVFEGQVVSASVDDSQPFSQGLVLPRNATAYLLLPLMADSQWIGVIQIDSCLNPVPWAALEVQQLTLAVAPLAQVQSRRLLQQRLIQQQQMLHHSQKEMESRVAERTTELEYLLQFESALKRLLEKVRDSLDEHQIMQTAVQEMVALMQLASCDAGIYDETLSYSTITYECAQSLPLAQGKVVEMADFPELYPALLRAHSLQFCCTESPRIRPSISRYTILACPIVDSQGVLGDLWLYRSCGQIFDEVELDLVAQVAGQCAIALRQSRLYQAAQCQVDSLESLHQQKDDFLTTVSHELRSPITNMKMAIQVLAVVLNRIHCLEDDIDTDEETLQDPAAQYLRILDQECDREIHLINDLLDLQRLNAGAHPSTTEPVDFNFLIPVLVESFQERARARQQQLQHTLPPSSPIIQSDPIAINRILTELLHNACKYTPPGQTIDIQVSASPQAIQIQVVNFGTEIPAHELPRIFDRFYRVSNGDRWQQGGTGLGLALVKSLTHHLYGAISVTSGSGHTCFTLTLPNHQADGLIQPIKN
ncbi:MAG: GAF domain-containing protein [Kaiparowitsia implicata GSE-PSE-MK54-09C]|jgi:signal transduction histidine kinase|nr:GAF domain-containing protein [Kaiparowitsia implicata GSE-PSE-MK54-09C]